MLLAGIYGEVAELLGKVQTTSLLTMKKGTTSLLFLPFSPLV